MFKKESYLFPEKEVGVEELVVEEDNDTFESTGLQTSETMRYAERE